MTVLFTDPHFGGKRAANTTPASRARMQDNVFTTVEQIIGSTHLEEPIICLGDLFDSYSNSEMTLIRSLPIVKRLKVCLAGNHDLVNDNVKTGSLELLRQLKDCKDTYFSYVHFEEIGFNVTHVDNTTYFSIPHISDQAKFEQALGQVRDAAARADDTVRYKYLLLHCNYDNPFCDETSLNLTKENTEELLQVFDTIVLGHEHSHRVDFGGRLVVLGNTYPTAFGDICDKFTMWVNDTTGEYQLNWHWRANTHYWEVDWKEAYGTSIEPDEWKDIEYVKITGEVAPSDTKQFSVLIKSLWSLLPNVCAIKSEVQFEGVTAANLEKGSLDRLPEIIAKELAGTEFEELWKELSNVN